jgi:DNA invertase Pin-like site-specific DNA recombinase
MNFLLLATPRGNSAGKLGTGTIHALHAGMRYRLASVMYLRALHARKLLLIAKLDRLARNVAFISALPESGVEPVCCDMPSANKLTLHILAAVVEHEREMISQRTKVTLAQIRARGVRLGRPDSNASTARSGRSATVAGFIESVRPEAD